MGPTGLAKLQPAILTLNWHHLFSVTMTADWKPRPGCDIQLVIIPFLPCTMRGFSIRLR